MSLVFKQGCRDRLVTILAENLKQAIVKKGRLLDYTSILALFAAEAVLPKTGPLREKLNLYISDMPMLNFIFETITADLGRTQQDNSGDVSVRP